jgi:hypothetical protein
VGVVGQERTGQSASPQFPRGFIPGGLTVGRGLAPRLGPVEGRSAGFDSQPAWVAATFLKSSSDRHEKQVGYSARAGRSTGEIPMRRDPRFRMLSSNWTSHQVDQTPHTETFGDLPQLYGAGRTETAQQTIAAKPLHPGLPVLGARTQPLEDPGQLLRVRGFSLAKESARIFDQL